MGVMSDPSVGVATEAGRPAADLGAPKHLPFVAIALVWSWALWIDSSLVGRAVGVEEMLFNKEAVWRICLPKREGLVLEESP
jgi:hypothetical protein